MQCNFLCTIDITQNNIQNSFLLILPFGTRSVRHTLALIGFNFCETILLTYNFSNVHAKIQVDWG